jgi:hypothetical protein
LAGLVLRRALRLVHRPEHLAGVDAEHQRPDQHEHERPAPHFAAASAGETSPALVLHPDAAGIERIEPHRTSLLCGCEITLDPAHAARFET